MLESTGRRMNRSADCIQRLLSGEACVLDHVSGYRTYTEIAPMTRSTGFRYMDSVALRERRMEGFEIDTIGARVSFREETGEIQENCKWQKPHKTGEWKTLRR